MASPNLTEIVTTTLYRRNKELADNVSNGNALLARLNEKGNVRPASGGRQIVEELEYAENSTFMYYSGYETLDISPSDVFSAAVFDWKQAAVNVSASGLEVEIKNNTVKIVKEGKYKKFVNDVQHLTFSGQYAAKNNQPVLFITERCVFKLTQKGMTLVEVAPGIDIEKDILSQMEFTPLIAKQIKLMDSFIFNDGPMNFTKKTKILQTETKKT